MGTLRNIQAKKSAPVKANLAMMEEESETKVETVQKSDFEVIDEDAVDRIAGFGAAPQEQFFEAGEEEVEAVAPPTTSFPSSPSPSSFSSTIAWPCERVFYSKSWA